MATPEVALGERIALARDLAGLTQSRVAQQVGLDRTALAKIEAGARRVSAVELRALAEVLDRPIDWFLRESAPAVVSYRASIDAPNGRVLERISERLARDVELLMDLGHLGAAPTGLPLEFPETFEAAERAARHIRDIAGTEPGPIQNLSRFAEVIGLLIFALDIGGDAPDGSFVSLEGGFGVAVINGAQDPGRRRFTAAHELGHHVFDDEYATDWTVDIKEVGREQMINAFSAHLLMPRESLARDWDALRNEHDERTATVVLASRYRVSTSALAAQLSNLKIISHADVSAVARARPTADDFRAFMLYTHEELSPPAVPRRYAEAVMRAYAVNDISLDRALELLRGAPDAADVNEQPPRDEWLWGDVPW